jgi:hypothetical protein
MPSSAPPSPSVCCAGNCSNAAVSAGFLIFFYRL